MLRIRRRDFIMPTLEKQIFVSYSRSDLPFLRKVMKSPLLRKLFWYDVEGIERCEPDWRNRVESAISRASGVFVLCSPAARSSQSITAELELALAYKKSIYPIWIEGDAWATSAPFSLLSYNYSDARGNLEITIAKIEEVAVSVVASWPAIISADEEGMPAIGVSQVLCSLRMGGGTKTTNNLPVTYINPFRFKTFRELASAIYDQYLSEQVRPFSYGTEWCLCANKIFFLPAKWAVQTERPVHLVAWSWLEQDLKNCGVVGGLHIELAKDPSHIGSFAGLVTKTENLDFIWRYAHKLHRAIPTKEITVEEIDGMSNIIQCCLLLGEGYRQKTQQFRFSDHSTDSMVKGQIYLYDMHGGQ